MNDTLKHRGILHTTYKGTFLNLGVGEFVGFREIHNSGKVSACKELIKGTRPVSRGQV